MDTLFSFSDQMFHDISGWAALVVGGTTFIVGMNGYILAGVFDLLGGNLAGTGVSMATVAGCALGGFIGEGLAQVIYDPSFKGRAQVIAKRMGYTALAAGLGSGFLGLILYYLAPGFAGNNAIVAALGALSAVMTSGRLGFLAPV